MVSDDRPSERHTVGVIGLGAMGLPIAGHLARSGLAVTVHDTDATRCELAAERGCVVAADAAAVGVRSGVALVLVPTDDDVRAVCLDLLDRAPGSTLVSAVRCTPRRFRRSRRRQRACPNGAACSMPR
jgi:3-hydroxyisobutyrate dehydrogenase-like beta-hydroxyacid dehydrogenase